MSAPFRKKAPLVDEPRRDCADCAHCRKLVPGGPGEDPQLLPPQEASVALYDLVCYDEDEDRWLPAAEVRADEEGCGEEARWFQGRILVVQ